jgi:DNA-binding NarL/FixJ family response regulator
LAEDDLIIRYSIRRILEKSCEIVAEAADGRKTVELAHELKPDLALLDISLPGQSGLEAARVIRAGVPEVRIIMVSNYSDPFYVNEAFLAGASGFVLKDSAIFELPQAIADVLGGKSYRSER